MKYLFSNLCRPLFDLPQTRMFFLNLVWSEEVAPRLKIVGRINSKAPVATVNGKNERFHSCNTTKENNCHIYSFIKTHQSLLQKKREYFLAHVIQVWKQCPQFSDKLTPTPPAKHARARQHVQPWVGKITQINHTRNKLDGNRRIVMQKF